MKNIWILCYGVLLQGIGINFIEHINLISGMCIPAGTILIVIGLKIKQKNGGTN